MGFLDRTRRVIVAAAASQNIDVMARRSGGDEPRGWQEKVFHYYDLLGEVENPTEFVALAMGSVDFYPAYRDDQGAIVRVYREPPVDPDGTVDQDAHIKPEVVDVWDAFVDETGERKRIQESYGRVRSLVGECLLFGRLIDGEERWSVVSTFELVKRRDKRDNRVVWEWKPGGGMDNQEFLEPPPDAVALTDGEAFVVRLWKPHPKQSGMAHSAWRAQLDNLQELYRMTLAVRARALSRAAGPGILFVNAALDGSVPTTPGEESPLMRDLRTAIVKPIQNPDDASAAVPIILSVDMGGEPGRIAELVRLYDDKPYPEMEMRERTTRRIARGIDLPAEILLGTEGLNHWSAWLVDEDAAKTYIGPFANGFADDVTQSYMHPALSAQAVEDWDRYTVGVDLSPIVSRPDEAKDSKDLHDRFVISDRALRRANGYVDADAPDDAELERRVTLLTGAPAAATQDTGPPDANAALQAAGVMRLMESAGSRIRNRMRDRAPDVPNHMMAQVLGAEKVREVMGHASSKLLARDSLAPFVSALAEMGVPDDRIAEWVVRVETDAAARLYRA